MTQRIEVLYHGTRAGFRGRGLLLPPAKTGAAQRSGVVLPAGWDDDRHEWVYVTPDLELAWRFAEGAPGRGKPKVLVIVPDGDFEVDASSVNGDDEEMYRCRAAYVVKVLKEGKSD